MNNISNRKRIFLDKSLLILLFLVACQPTTITRMVPTSTLQEPTPPPVTFVAIQTPMVSPSVTPAPFAENSQILELPRWVQYSFPGGILALPYGDGITEKPSRLIFVNPEDGETFIVELQKDFYHYLWKDDENIVFLHEGDCNGLPKFISELNIPSGLLWIRENTGDLPRNIRDCYFSRDADVVRLNHESKESVVEYVDPISGEVSLLTDPDDGVSDISMELSPYDHYVAIVQFDGEFEMPKTRGPVYGNTISIFDLRTHKLILQYSEEQGVFSEVSFIDEVSLAYMRQNTPCLILILSQIKRCVHNIPNQFPDATIILVQNSHHDSSLQFLYFSQEEGGYCAYDIIGGALGCLTDRFSVFHNQFIINYSSSYYGHYRLIEYSSDGCPEPWCENPETTYLALVNQEGELFELGSSDRYYLSSLFRPLRPNPWLPWH